MLIWFKRRIDGYIMSVIMSNRLPQEIENIKATQQRLSQIIAEERMIRLNAQNATPDQRFEAVFSQVAKCLADIKNLNKHMEERLKVQSDIINKKLKGYETEEVINDDKQISKIKKIKLSKKKKAKRKATVG